MSVGNGGYGLAAPRRGHGDFQFDDGARRQGYVHHVLGRAFTKDGAYGGGIYYTDLDVDTDLTWLGVPRPIVGIETMHEPRALVWAETQAAMAAGTFTYDDETVVLGGTVRLYYWLPDSADPGTEELVAHLLFTYSTRDEVHPLLLPEQLDDPGFAYWDDVNTPTYWTPEGVNATTGVVVSRSTEVEPASRDSYSCQVAAGSAMADDAGGGVVHTVALKALGGRAYWFSLAYQTDENLPTGVYASLRVQAATSTFMLIDGILTQAGANELELPPTYGAWRRALFVFRAPVDALTAAIHCRLFNASGGAVGTGWVRFDSAGFKGVLRYARYAALLEATAIPEVEIRAAHAAYGPKSTGVGTVTVIDGGRELTKAMLTLLPMRKPLQVFVGGQFSNGDELYRDDWRTAFFGLVEQPRCLLNEGKVVLDVVDTRWLLSTKALDDTWRDDVLTDMARVDSGRPKALLFGDSAYPILKGTRVTVDANGYGGYEFLDPRVPVAEHVAVGLPDGWVVKVYPNEELADKDEKGYELASVITAIQPVDPGTKISTATRHGLTTGDAVTISGSNSDPVVDGRHTVTVENEFDFTIAAETTDSGNTGKLVSHADLDLSNYNTRWTIKRDLQNLRYDRSGEDGGSGLVFAFKLGWIITNENNKLAFAVGAGAQQIATVTTGTYTSGSSLATAIQTALNTANPQNWVVSYSGGQFTIAITGGNQFLLYFSGVSAGLVVVAGAGSIHKDIGFNSQDYALAATRTAEETSYSDRTTKPLKATLDVEGPPWKVALDLRAALRTAVGGGDTTMNVVYSESTHLFTVSKSSGVLSLVAPGPPASAQAETIIVRNGWAWIGFEMSIAKEGATSYVADQPMFESADGDHVFRFPGGGFHDDAAGTICGTPNASLNTPPAIVSWLWQKVARRPRSAINLQSFIQAQDRCVTEFTLLFMYLQNGDTDLQTAFEILDEVGVMDTFVDGDGMLLCRKHDDAAPVKRVLRDRDYVSFELLPTDASLLFKGVKLWGSYHPARGRFETYADAPAQFDEAHQIKSGASDLFEVDAFLDREVIHAGTQLGVAYYARLFNRVPMAATIQVVGKLIDLLIGDVIQCTYLDVVVGVEFRIIGLRHDYLSGLSTATLIENVDLWT